MNDNHPRPLFRQSAVDHQRERLHGDVLLLPKLSFTVITVLLLVWLLLVGIWLLSNRYAQKETVFGWLEPPTGVVRVFHQDSGGIVDSLLVEEGDQVRAGQPLAVVNASRVLASGDNLSAGLRNELNAQRQRIESQMERGKEISLARQSELSTRIELADVELTLLEQQIDTTIERKNLMRSQARSASGLQESGFISVIELNSIRAQELALEEQLQELRREVTRQTNLISQYKSEQDLLPKEFSNSRDVLNDRLSTISQEILQLDSRQSYAIVAPKSGVVNNLQVIEGQQLQFNSNVPLMSILPSDSSFTVQLLVPVSAAGFLEEGQPLNIRYDAFPHQKYGMYAGEIVKVSRTLLLPNEISNAPIATDLPVYRIVGIPQDTEIKANGRTFALKAGMTLSADIQLGERSLIEWVFAPIFNLQGRF